MVTQPVGPIGPAPDDLELCDKYLPAQRPHPITPPPRTPSSVHAIDNSPFFKLPSELRRQILVEAFGDRIVHVDLRFDHPFSSRGATPCTIASSMDWALPAVGHCGRVTVRSSETGHREFERDTAQPRRWIWHGYIEGVDVLYSTNIFYIIDNAPLVSQLPRLIPSQHVDSITSLELCFHVESPPDGGWPDPNNTTVKSALVSIPNNFPGLRRLTIDVHGYWQQRDTDWRAFLDSYDSHLFTPVTDTAAQLPRLEECILLIPHYVFCPLVAEGTRPRHRRLFAGVWTPPYITRGVWRPFRTSVPNKRRRSLRDFNDGIWIATADRSDGHMECPGAPWMDDWGCVDDVRLKVKGYEVFEAGPV